MSSEHETGEKVVIVVLEFTVEGTLRDDVEFFVTRLRNAAAKLREQKRFASSVAISTSLDDITYER